MVNIIIITVQVLVVFGFGFTLGKTGEIKKPGILKRKAKSAVSTAPTYGELAEKQPEKRAASKLLKRLIP